MPAPSDVMKQKGQPVPQGSPQQSSLYAALAKALGPNATIMKAVYVGRDATGKPMYRVIISPTYGYNRLGPAKAQKSTKLITFQNGQIGNPNLQNAIPPAQGGGTEAPQNNADLDAAKAKWFNQLATMNFPNEEIRRKLFNMVDNFQGSPLALSQMVEQQLAFRTSMAPGPDDYLNDLLGGLGGGGGGFTGPQYVAPDRRVVEDFVKGTMVSLLGTVDDALVAPLTDLYMKDHRRNFDVVDREIDPAQSVLEALRDTDEYLSIHELRPDSEDERTWVSARRQAAAQGGLNQGLQEDFAIAQATAGGDLPDVQDAAGIAQFQATGNVAGTTLQQKMSDTLYNMFNGVGR